jgi:hypothetical protein
MQPPASAADKLATCHCAPTARATCNNTASIWLSRQAAAHLWADEPEGVDDDLALHRLHRVNHHSHCTRIQRLKRLQPSSAAGTAVGEAATQTKLLITALEVAVTHGPAFVECPRLLVLMWLSTGQQQGQHIAMQGPLLPHGSAVTHSSARTCCKQHLTCKRAAADMQGSSQQAKPPGPVIQSCPCDKSWHRAPAVC